MPRFDPRSVLAIPAVYAAFRRLISGAQAQDVLMRRYVRAAPGSKVLDIGCGPGVMADALPGVDYTGIEPDARYVEEGRRRLAGRGRILHGTAGSVRLPDPGSYDVVMAIAVLHHLDDWQARELVTFAKAALKPGGRFVSLDCCYTPVQSRIARLIVGMDRGRHIRTPEAFAALIAERFSTVTPAVHHDLLRVPYTHVICTAEA